MKAQRRHELHHNLLRDWLTKQLEVVKPYTTWILGGVIALASAAIVVQLITGSSSSTSGASWTNYFTATAMSDPEKKAEELAKLENTNTAAGLWAHLAEAELRLEQATTNAYSDRDASKKALAKAREHYEKVIVGAARQPMLLQRAQFGLAQACETGEEFEKAREIYTKLVDAAPESIYGKSAGRRLKRLGSTDLKAFSTMLAAHKPVEPPKKRSPGLDGPGGMHGFDGFGGLGGLGGAGGMPDFGAPLPERPDLSLPGPSLDFPATEKPDAEKTDDPKKEPTDPEKKGDEPEKKADPEKKPAEPEKKGDESEKKPGEPEKKPEAAGKKPAESEKKSEEEKP